MIAAKVGDQRQAACVLQGKRFFGYGFEREVLGIYDIEILRKRSVDWQWHSIGGKANTKWVLL